MDTKQLETFEAGLISKLKALFAPKIKAGKLASGDITLYFDGETYSIGQSIFTDEAMTAPVADGEYPTEGNTIIVKEGKVAEIVDQPAGVNAELEKEIATLKAQLESKESELQSAITTKAELETQVAEAKSVIEEVKVEFQNFKSTFVTGGGDVKPDGQDFKGDVTPKKSIAEQVIELRKNQNSKNN